MIDLIDIIRAVSRLTEEVLGYPPTTKDITEGFARPCAYIQPGPSLGRREGDIQHDTYHLDILYFAPRSRTGYLDLLTIQERLKAALERPIQVTPDCSILPEDLEADPSRLDMLTAVSFTAEVYQAAPDPDSDAVLMDRLNLDV